MLGAVTMRGLARRALPAAVGGVAMVVGVGCASDHPSGRPSTPARLAITSPAPNVTTGRAVDVVLRLDRARVVPSVQVGGRIRADRGHIHLSVDGQLVAMPAALEYRVPELRPGSHTIEAEFVATDHVPFANRVVAAVTFRVR